MVVPNASLISRTAVMETLVRLTDRREEIVLFSADLGAVTGEPWPLARWASHVRAERPRPDSVLATAAGSSFCLARNEVPELKTRAGDEGSTSAPHGSVGGAPAPASEGRSNSEAINSPPAEPSMIE